MRIIHISDSHISVDKPVREDDLRRCIQRINETTPKADAVIHTGDISHDGLTVEYVTAKRHLTDLEAPLFVLAGNRDNREELIDEFADNQTISKGDRYIQYSVETFPVRLIILDTVSVTGNTRHSSGSNKGRLCKERLSHLKTMLGADTTRPVAIFMHHSPFEATSIPDPFQFEHWHEVERFHELLAGHPDIRGIFCGHIHRNAKAEAGGIPIRAITCMACDLRKGEITPEERSEPAIRVLDFD